MFKSHQILILVKTYPNPSKKYQETVCVAGVLLGDSPSWIRLYPVPYRNLDIEQQFKKYQIIQAEVKPNEQDFRPESYKINADSIKILDELGTKNKWEKRKEHLLPLLDSSMCEIQKTSEQNKKSLGIFKPLKIEDFIIENEKSDWNESQKQHLSQMNIFLKDKKILEKIPYKFKLKYYCSDKNCNGHNQSIIDWETAQLYRNLKRAHKQNFIEKIKEKYLNQIFSSDRDPYLIVGNQLEGPRSFLILSVFWPPLENQLPLFS